MATDGQILVAAARWSDEGLYLKDFSSVHTFPSVVKIVKGQYGGLGVPSLPNPGLQSIALLHSAGRRRKILAQAVKIKEGRRVVGVGPRLEIPESYPGYFELLSEEGRAMRSIESVIELSRRRTENGCLVREPIRAIVIKYDADNVLTTSGAKIIITGEILHPKTEMQLSGYKTRFLHCVDSKGDNVLLGLEQKGKFSILAKEDNISGVHTTKNLFSKRMPLTVRLVHGPPPKGLKSSSQFIPELRLLAVAQEECIYAMPLQKDTGSVIPLSLGASLKLQSTRNSDVLKGMKEFQRLTDKCSSLVKEALDRPYILDSKFNSNHYYNSNNNFNASNNRGDGLIGSNVSSNSSNSSPPGRIGYFLRRSASLDSPTGNNNTNIAHSNNNNSNSTNNYIYVNENRAPGSVATDDYDDIDQIYDYVRGFAPLPKNMRSPFADPHSAAGAEITSSNNCFSHHAPLVPSNHHHHPIKGEKPEPPPIETIPTKKMQPVSSFPSSSNKAEKRTRKTTDHTKTSSDKNISPVAIYVKNANTQRGRILRQKSASPMKEPPSINNNSKTNSPFSIRYKSLNNLQQAMEMDGTLDSSHSDGRTSGDSGACAKLPEKRSRRLSRPLSLTNLVWEICREPYRSQDLQMPIHRKSLKSSAQPARVGTLYL